MEVEKLLAPITNRELRNQFRTFLATGEASEPFLDLLDSKPEYQNIVETAFKAQASALERFAERLETAESRAERMPLRTAAEGAAAAVAGAFAGVGAARAARAAANREGSGSA